MWQGNCTFNQLCSLRWSLSLTLFLLAQHRVGESISLALRGFISLSRRVVFIIAVLLVCLTFIKLLGLLNEQRITPYISVGIKPPALISCFLLLQSLLLSTWPHHPVGADTQSTAPAFLCTGVQIPLVFCVFLAMWICTNQCSGNRGGNSDGSVNN